MLHFWKWMEEKGYAALNKGVDGMLASYNSTTNSYSKTSFIDTAKQMLIGYMEEYLLIEHSMGIGNRDDIYRRLHKGETYENIRYDQLEEEIIKQTKIKSM